MNLCTTPLRNHFIFFFFLSLSSSFSLMFLPTHHFFFFTGAHNDDATRHYEHQRQHGTSLWAANWASRTKTIGSPLWFCDGLWQCYGDFCGCASGGHMFIECVPNVVLIFAGSTDGVIGLRSKGISYRP